MNLARLPDRSILIYHIYIDASIYRYMLCYAKSLQLCPTLCNPIDGSPPGSTIPGILQARTLEWAYRYIVYIKINRILYISNKFHFIS